MYLLGRIELKPRSHAIFINYEDLVPNHPPPPQKKEYNAPMNSFIINNDLVRFVQIELGQTTFFAF